jgi:hypothetical protein
MIPDLFLHRPIDSAARAARRCRVALLPMFLGAVFSASCDKAPLVAPTGTTIRLTTNAQVLPLNGTAEITANVIESGGNSVQNGTMVTFTTSLGTITPSDVGTTNGKATATFNAGSLSGTAVINAFSGANSTSGSTSSGTGGATTSTGSGVSIVVGSAAASAVVVTASPSSVSQRGGTSVITATVYDANNNGVSGAQVSFTTDQGTISPVNATTNAAGQAQTTLSTTQSATVTATVGAKSGTAKVTTTPLPTVTITGPTTTPTVGLTSIFTVTVAPGSGSAPISSVTLTFTDGSVPVNLGAPVGAVSVPHVFIAIGTFTATATATDTSGQSNSASVPIQVFPAVPFTLTVNPSTVTAVINITLVSFTVTPNAGSPAIDTYTWDFGDGILETTTTPFNSHRYLAVPNGQPSQQVAVTVTATGGGRTGYGSCVITVTR